MKFKPALLLCGIVLIAAVPAWGDRIPYCGIAQKSPDAGTSLKVIRNSGLKINAPANGEFLADPTPSVMPKGNSEAIKALYAWDSKPPSALVAFLPISSDVDIYAAGLRGLVISERVSSLRDGMAWSVQDGEGRARWRDRDRHFDADNDSPTPAPEPGTLSFMLLGLAGVGFLALRRG
jgi:hypothetical protein